MSEEKAVRDVDGLTLPAAGKWEIDPDHSSVEFVSRHVLTKVRGRFKEFSGTIEVADKPEESRVQVEIVAASIDTDTPDRDKHLRSPDFLDVENFPKLTFVSKELHPKRTNRFDVVGDLTIRNITCEVILDTEYVGVHDSPWGTVLASFSARTTLEREDWGITWNLAIETGGFLVGKSVDLELEVEAVYKG